MTQRYTYITFGQTHTHSVEGLTLDRDCVLAIPSESEGEGRARAFELLGPRWCFSYWDRDFDLDTLRYFPRGIMRLGSKRSDADGSSVQPDAETSTEMEK